MARPILLTCALLVHGARVATAAWFPVEAVRYAISQYETHEANNNVSFAGSREPAFPFISGDGFRHRCGGTNQSCLAGTGADRRRKCDALSPELIADGSCVFVDADMWYFFAVKVAPRIPGRYTVVVHNGDQSSPDGANEKDEDGATMRHVIRQHKTSHIMEQEWEKGRLIAHHTGNLWWRPAEDRSTYNATYTRFTRPPFLHCLPIGIENRQWW